MNTFLMRSMVAALAVVGTALGPVRADEADAKIESWLEVHCGELSRLLATKESRDPLGDRLVEDGVVSVQDRTALFSKIKAWTTVAFYMKNTCPITPAVLNPGTATATDLEIPKVVPAPPVLADVAPAVLPVVPSAVPVVKESLPAKKQNLAAIVPAPQPRRVQKTTPVRQQPRVVTIASPRVVREKPASDWRDKFLTNGLN